MEESKYSELVQHYSDMVYRIAYSYLKNREDAEDIYQEVFLKALYRREGFREQEHAKRWLIRVTVNACHSLYRSPWKRRRQECDDWNVLSEKSQASEGWQVFDSLEEVRDMLSGLPAKYSIVLYLFYYEDYSTKEIAKMLKRKESTVRTQLMRGKELLKKRMEERGFYHE